MAILVTYIRTWECLASFFFFFYGYGAPRDLPSSPPRRSPDLVDDAAEAQKAGRVGKQADLRGMMKSARTGKPKPGFNIAGKRLRDLWLRDVEARFRLAGRSEQHTSELQPPHHLLSRPLP